MWVYLFIYFFGGSRECHLVTSLRTSTSLPPSLPPTTLLIQLLPSKGTGCQFITEQSKSARIFWILKRGHWVVLRFIKKRKKNLVILKHIRA